MNNQFSDLLGRVIDNIDGIEAGSDAIYWHMSDGPTYRMSHHQDCCESVSVADVIGDPTDLIGSPILLAEESSGCDDPVGYNPPGYRESYTWTFYRIATAKGHVDIRWLGESNGWYSESVDFEKVA